MARKLLALTFLLTLVAAACAEPPNPEIEFGSGRRFVPLVADSLNDAGRHADVILDQDGRPIVAYFAFEERTAEGVLPQTRPVGAPTVPGVLMATMSEEGIWTRGAMALEAQIPNVSVPFAPGFDSSIADLIARDVTGLDVVVDGGAFHAVWASAEGVSHATGSTDPNTTEQVRISQVTSEPGVGPSIAVDGGQPLIAFSTSGSGAGEVRVATPDGEGWQVDTVAEADGCATCTTAAVATADGPAVAYSNGGDGVSIATSDGGNGWVSAVVDESGGQGLDGAATEDGIALSYYRADQITTITGPAGGPFEPGVRYPVPEGSDSEDGAATSVAVAPDGSIYSAWSTRAGVSFGSDAGGGSELIDTGDATVGGAYPSVAVSPDGATAYLAWYDTEHQDALLGAYGEIEGLAVAEPSPEPTGAPAPPTGGDCTEPIDGVVDIVARGVAFDTSCIDVPAGESFTIAFDNEDTVPHNVAIYPSADLGDPLFQGETFTGPDSREYPPVDPLEADEYYFQCDVHPQMNGTVNADSAGGGGGDGGGGDGGGGDGGGGDGGGGDGGGGGAALTVVAQNIAFDTSTIELPADTASTITFDNQDAGTSHNIAIYTDDSASESLFPGEVITGPDTIDYTIPPLEAGEYYFRCDVHPQMDGTVVVA